MARQPRHPPRHLFWRGAIATVTNTAMLTGLYPIIPHASMMWARQRANLSSPPGQLKAMTAEWLVAVAMVAARPIGFWGLPVSLRKQPGPRPIILVHGYAMNRSNFLPLARHLAKAGLGPILGFEYWSLGKTSSAARRLGEYVETVCQKTGSDTVDIIGHSMGGVVGRYYVTLGGGSPRVHNLITIGSPHRGTDLSIAGIGRPKKELFVESTLVQRLEAAPRPASTRITVIWSRSDALVPSARYARIPGADEIIYDDLGHLTMLVSPRVTREIVARLRG